MWEVGGSGVMGGRGREGGDKFTWRIFGILKRFVGILWRMDLILEEDSFGMFWDPSRILWDSLKTRLMSLGSFRIYCLGPGSFSVSPRIVWDLSIILRIFFMGVPGILQRVFNNSWDPFRKPWDPSTIVWILEYPGILKRAFNDSWDLFLGVLGIPQQPFNDFGILLESQRIPWMGLGILLECPGIP